LPGCLLRAREAGLVRVSLNTRETEDNHRFKLKDSGSRAVIHGGGWGPLGVELTIDPERMRALVRDADARPCCVDRAPEAPLRLGYTGGTTGQPKAVTLTTRGELAELSAFLTDLVPDISSTDTFLHAAPIAHASGAFFLRHWSAVRAPLSWKSSTRRDSWNWRSASVPG